jgi:RNA polymerase sigma-70 factor (ECF subfamily)
MLASFRHIRDNGRAMLPSPIAQGLAMPQKGSFEEIMARLRRGDDAAAAAVFNRFARKLIRLARCQLDTGLRHKVEPEDVVQSVYRSFFTRFCAGQFDIGTWNELWGLLTLIALRKCANRAEYFRAQCRDARREVHEPPAADDSGLRWEAIDRAPTPVEAAVLAETVEQVLRGVDASERPILELSLQGYTAQEISAQLRRAERTVQRVRERLKRQLLRLQADDREGP